MIIVKVGGGQNINTNGIIQDLKSLNKQVVFVHGASHQRDRLAKKLKIHPKQITSPSGMTSVLTDQPGLDLLTMVYAGLINKRWVSQFQAQGINAVGLSGADGQLLKGQRKHHLIAVENGKQKLISGTHTGKVTSSNSSLIKLLLKNSYLPVITQPAITSDGELINTDNDRNLAVLAKDLKVKELIILFQAPGLLKDPKNESTLIKTISAAKLDQYMDFAQGTMKKKILGAKEAFDSGVKKIYWGDSRTNHPVKSALLGDGTVIS